MAQIKLSQLPSSVAPSSSAEVFVVDGGVSYKTSILNIIKQVRNIDPLVHIPFKRQDDEVALSGLQTFARASTSTYIDPLDGLVKTAAINTPRFERMADGGTGILLEGAITNMARQSENSAFAQVTGMTVSLNLYTAPDGLTTMDGVVEDGVSTVCNLYWIPAAVTSGTIMTNSVFISKTGRRYWQIGCGAFANNFGAVLDTLTGVITSSGANGTNIFTSAKVEDIGGAWRVSITGVLNYTVPYLLVIATDSPTWVSNTVAIIPAANTTGIWGAQIEQLPFASSYIPTTTAAVTRAADKLSISASGNLLPINSAFTILADADYKGEAGVAFPLNAVQLFENTGNFRYFISTGNAHIAGTVAGGNNPAINTVARLGAGSDLATVKTFLDGVVVGSATAVNTASASNLSLSIGSDYNGNYPMYGHIRNFRIYDQALTSVEIAAA